jgi:manganese/zinc/iron transport system permease protein
MDTTLMSSMQIDIQLIAMVTAVSCALPGVFLVLRGMAMMGEAISHSVLLGIVTGFYFFTQDLHSPILVASAAVMGVITVTLVELLHNTKLVKEDAAIGLVFPALFSIAVVLISVFGRNLHLHTTAVLKGELVFAPFDRFQFAGNAVLGWLPAIGIESLPKSLVVMSVIMVMNIIFIIVFYKELKLATFDKGLAASLGFAPVLIHYALMTLVSITAVGAFDAVGSILVLALIIGPPAAAHLLTDRLPVMLVLSAFLGMLGAVGGYWVSHWTDTTISGAMAVMVGVLFALVLLFAPDRGLVGLAMRRMHQRKSFSETMLITHLYHHENTPQMANESRVEHMHRHMQWDEQVAKRVVQRAERRGLLQNTNGVLSLTQRGHEAAEHALQQIGAQCPEAEVEMAWADLPNEPPR